jgi:hypothetical protein
MAVNITGSMTGSLAEGATDGTYKKVVRDRGGVVEPGTYAARSQMDDMYYGFHEAQDKILGDGTMHTTPDYVTTPQPDMLRW